MGNSIPNTTIVIKTNVDKTFRISYHDLVGHILLLRQVIAHPEMTQQGSFSNFYINQYCEQMAQQKMGSAFQQLMLPWQLDWIWHIHRLHPLAYYADCSKHRLDGQLVDKKVHNLNAVDDRSVVPLTSTTSDSSAHFCSIDLAKAVVRQRTFLDKFREHFLYSRDLRELDSEQFHQMVRNYVSFMKLARKNEMIVPTFNIDLIWHTHMRFPTRYREFSKTMCGFVLDHNDSIQRDKLKDGYKKTANRWKDTYKSTYHHTDDLIILESNQDQSYWTVDDQSASISTWTEQISSDTGADGECGSGCSSCGGD